MCPNVKLNVAANLIHKSKRLKKFTVILQADFRILQATIENIDNKTAAICFDYMQNLPLSHIPVQEVFYL